MKQRFTLLVAITLFSVSINAQKGSWYLGGSLGISSDKSKSDVNGNSTTTGKGSSWGFGPEIGTFLTDHVQVGLGLNFSGAKSEINYAPNTIISRLSMYGGSVYSRYFFGNETFKPFAGVNITYLSGKQKTENALINSESTAINFSSEINAGFSYALSKRVTSIGSFGFLGYSQSTNKTADNAKLTSSSFGFDASSLGNRFTVGFYYTL